MFGSSGAQPLGYASGAILIALMRKLVSRGLLTQDEVSDLLDDATRSIKSLQNLGSIAGAITIIDDVKRRVAA